MATKTREQDAREHAPGTGAIWWTKDGKHEVLQIWEGNAKLVDGTLTRFIAKITKPEGAKKPRFNVTVKKIAETSGDTWNVLSEFEMPGFTKTKQEQDIDIPNLGKATLRIKSAGINNQCIQIKFANAPRVGHMVPM